jgi:hypothetical protein
MAVVPAPSEFRIIAALVAALVVATLVARVAIEDDHTPVRDRRFERSIAPPLEAPPMTFPPRAMRRRPP